MKLFNKKSILFFLAILLAPLFYSGCALNKAQVNRPDLINKNKNIFIYGNDDKANIHSTVRKNFVKLGFNIVENKEEAGLIVDYNGKCGWDVIHYTCEQFNLFVTDNISGDIVLKSKFVAGSPLSASSLIDDMFDEIKVELDKAMAKPNNSPDSHSSGR